MSKLETIQGTVVGVTQDTNIGLQRRVRLFRGGPLTLETVSGPLTVQIPRREYMKREDFELELGDEIEIVGTKKPDSAGESVLIAARLKKGDRVLRLRPYHPEDGVSARGQLVDFRDAARARRARVMIATVRTEAETVAVRLAPAGHLRRQGFRLASGDVLEITGWRAKSKGTPTFFAAEVRKQNQALRIRGPDGSRLWGTVNPEPRNIHSVTTENGGNR